MHFSRQRADQDPSGNPSVSAGPITVSESTERPYLRWLGVLFDKRLTFKWHAIEMAARALVVARALQSLGNTVCRVLPYLVR